MSTRFHHLCKKEDLVCKRARAKIPRDLGMRKRDEVEAQGHGHLIPGSSMTIWSIPGCWR